MLYILYALFFIACIVLVGSVLLQPGKTDAGALFTSNVSSTAFSPRGTASVLSKVTIAAAAVFMISALLISMPALTGNVSVLQGTAESPAETPADVPAQTTTEVPIQTTTEAVIQPGLNVINANTAPAVANSNGALIETPATEAFSEDANTANAAPANR